MNKQDTPFVLADDVRDTLILSILPWIKILATRYGRTYNMEDHIPALVNEAVVTLLEVTDRFDPGRGTSYITFAGIWVHGAIRDYIKSNRHVVQVGVHMQERVTRLLKRKEQVEQQLGRELSLDELIDFGFSADEVAVLKKPRVAQIVSVSTIERVFTKGRSESDRILSKLFCIEVMNIVHTYLYENFPPIRARAMVLYYGFEGESLSTSEIAQRLGMEKIQVSTYIRPTKKYRLFLKNLRRLFF